MRETNNKRYDLEDRTYTFARNVRLYVKNLQKSFINFEDCKQLLRASGSIGANYREANEALSKKDFQMRIKIARKESKEAIYWLQLLECDKPKESAENSRLTDEAIQLMKIFGAILEKST